ARQPPRRWSAPTVAATDRPIAEFVERDIAWRRLDSGGKNHVVGKRKEVAAVRRVFERKERNVTMKVGESARPDRVLPREQNAAEIGALSGFRQCYVCPLPVVPD